MSHRKTALVGFVAAMAGCGAPTGPSGPVRTFSISPHAATIASGETVTPVVTFIDPNPPWTNLLGGPWAFGVLPRNLCVASWRLTQSVEGLRHGQTWVVYSENQVMPDTFVTHPPIRLPLDTLRDSILVTVTPGPLENVLPSCSP